MVLNEYKRTNGYYITRVQEDNKQCRQGYYATAPPSETTNKMLSIQHARSFAELNYSKHCVIEGGYKFPSRGFKVKEAIPLATILFIYVHEITRGYQSISHYPFQILDFHPAPPQSEELRMGDGILSINLMWGSHDGSLSRKY